MSDPQPDHATVVAAVSAALVGLFAVAQLSLLGGFAALIARYGTGGLLLFGMRKAARRTAGQLDARVPALVEHAVMQAAASGAAAGGSGTPADGGSLFGDSWESHAERSARAIREDLAGKLNQLNYPILRFADDAYQAVISDAAQEQVLGSTPARAQAHAYRDLTRRGVDGFTDSRGRKWELSAYVEMAVRTAVQRAYNVSHLDRMLSLGIHYFTVTDDGHPCPLCVVSGTVVSGPAPVGAVRTEYTGNLVTIRTALGNELTATPDHSVLTPNGWRRMKDLAPGDKVIHDGGQELLASLTMPDHVQVPTRIEDVVKPGLPLLLARPTSGELDVNIVYREVEVVDPNRVLLSESDLAFAEPFGDLLLIPRVGECLSCLNERGLALSLDGARDATASIVGRADHSLPLLGSASSPLSASIGGVQFGKDLRVHRIESSLETVPTGASSDTGPTDVVARTYVADAEGGTDLALGFTSKVAADEIVSLEISQFSGHVWDIQTRQNWYSSNGIISHNCAPWEGAVLTDGVPDGVAAATIADATAAGLFHHNCRHVLVGFIPGVTVLPAPHVWNADDQAKYDESQRQRAIERQIRAAKRELAGAPDPESKRAAQQSVRAAQARMRQFIDATGRVRNSRREQLNLGNKP
jgi:Intein/homing endonuclease